jgi:glycosyltransferase involved in cell wall biosynthesis
MYSLIVPVYMNEASIADLIEAITGIDRSLDHALECVFVVDGSSDRSLERLKEALPSCGFRSKLVLLSRNFGSFAAIRTGMAEASGPYFAVMAADLQEPPELIIESFRALETGTVDVAIGTRTERDDPRLSQWQSRLFWRLYRRAIQPEMPPGGVDIFATNQVVRDRLLSLGESNSSLVGLLFWMGFRKKLIPYRRVARAHGESAWTLSKKLRYLSDSMFAFSDLPVRMLMFTGGLGMAVSVVFGMIVLVARSMGWIGQAGYAAIVTTVIFFAALNMFGLGIIGSYVWRTFENTKGRPGAIVMSREDFDADGSGDEHG